MLGRQQIAGVPTALSELFKNAHDAYATRVQADFLRAERLLVVRDDGTGMSRPDFERRWLTLAGDSKLGKSRAALSGPPAGMDERPLLGEKGIGRLAVAIIGRVLVVLTRVRGEASTTCALVHWGLFEMPGLTLDDVLVPIVETSGGVGADVVEVLRDELLDWLDGLSRRGRLSAGDLETVLSELASLNLDPGELEDLWPGPSLRRDGHGTQFFIWPTDEQVTASIDEDPPDGTAPPLVSTLVGFANTVLPDSPPSSLTVAFNDHLPNRARPLERIAGENFFSADEFAEADHTVTGSFDAFGRFSGTVHVYGSDEPQHYVLPYVNGHGEQLNCGAFSLELAILQPLARESRMDAVAHAALSKKMGRVGGVYVYRAGIRVQPYGGPDVDWLGIERRRSMNAGRAYFSHRRMFGGVILDYDENEDLKEKAGREGFRENKAFRQLRDVLQSFFIGIARDVFVKGGEQAEDFLATKRSLELNERLRKEREAETAERQRELELKLRQMASREVPAELRERAEQIVAQLAARLKPAVGPDDVFAAESAAIEALASVDASLEAPRARSGLTAELRTQLSAYEGLAERLRDEIVRPAQRAVALSVDRSMKALTPNGNPDDLLGRAVETAGRQAEDRLAQAATDSQHLSEAVPTAQRRLIERLRADLADAIALVRQDARAPWTRSDVAAAARAVELRERVTHASREALERLELASETLARVVEDLEAGAAASGSVTSALEEELLDLRSMVDDNQALAQIGMTVELVQHEINIVAQDIRDNLRTLRRWAAGTPALTPVYEGLRGDFDHLDSFLSVLSPLQRRLGRRRVTMTGGELHAWLLQAFGMRLQANRIELTATDAFKSAQWVGFRANFYPTFGNLLDNASFWASPARRADAREQGHIRLDAAASSLILADDGPGVRPSDRDRVFELWWTTRTAGRGAGLYLARAALAREGWTIAIAPQSSLGGTDFVMTPPADSDD